MAVVSMGLGAILGAMMAVFAWAVFSVSGLAALMIYLGVTFGSAICIIALHLARPARRQPMPAFLAEMGSG